MSRSRGQKCAVRQAKAADGEALPPCEDATAPGQRRTQRSASSGCAFYLFIRQPMGRKSALRREIPWIPLCADSKGV